MSESSTPGASPPELGRFVDALEGRLDAILAAWRARVERDPASNAVSHLTRSQFIDHIPLVLRGMCHELRNLNGESSVADQQLQDAAANSHSQHRWQQGYDMRELVDEWGHLNACLVAAFEEMAPNFSHETSANARRVLAETMGKSLSKSVVEYSRLLQSEAQSRMRELENALEQLRKLEQERAQLLRGAVHDLRGNVGIVSGTVNLLGDERLDEGEREEMRGLLHRGTSSLQQMLTDLMDMARLEAGQEKRHIAPFDAGQLLSELCRTSQSLAQERGLILQAFGNSCLIVEGDALKVRRIAQNLLLNALKYTPQGSVTVRWEAPDETHWSLSVEDTGPGLPAQQPAITQNLKAATDLAHAVENEKSHAPLKTSPIAFDGGEGIGLSIVKRLCELLDATIEVETQPQVGTRFRVIFPRKS